MAHKQRFCPLPEPSPFLAILPIALLELVQKPVFVAKLRPFFMASITQVMCLQRFPRIDSGKNCVVLQSPTVSTSQNRGGVSQGNCENIASLRIKKGVVVPMKIDIQVRRTRQKTGPFSVEEANAVVRF